MSHSKHDDLQTGEVSWTILKLLSWTSDYFASHNIEHPRGDAETLLASILGLRRIDLYVQYDKPLTQQELANFHESIRRRIQREPVAYIIGAKEFWSLELRVTPDVLIPRPETECLVEAALAVLSEISEPGARRILELGTGSGAVILALATERQGDILWATDQSDKALSVARENADHHGLLQRLSFFCGDWFEPFNRETVEFDLILSNPPYIRRGDIPNLQPEIFRFEPKAALDGGPVGIDCLVHIIVSAPDYLRPGGCLLLEMGHDQREMLEREVEKTGCYRKAEFLKDYSGHDRVLKIRKKTQKYIA